MHEIAQFLQLTADSLRGGCELVCSFLLGCIGHSQSRRFLLRLIEELTGVFTLCPEVCICRE
ncbi:hypothetical protein AS149_37530 [Burkholderia cenocepacia]|nr:hypothetical protein AS149_37530 [Burkholderia cenocepacia]